MGLNYEAHGKRRSTHPVSESWGKHGPPWYLNSLPSIESSKVLRFPWQPTKNRRVTHTNFPYFSLSLSLSLSLFLFLSLLPHDPLIGDARVSAWNPVWFTKSSPAYNHTTVRWPYDSDHLSNCQRQIPSLLFCSIYLSLLSFYVLFPQSKSFFGRTINIIFISNIAVIIT